MSMKGKLNLDKAKVVQILNFDTPIAWFYSIEYGNQAQDNEANFDPDNDNVGIMGGKTDGKDKIAALDNMFVSKAMYQGAAPEPIKVKLVAIAEEIKKKFAGTNVYIYPKLYKGRVLESYEPIRAVNKRITERLKIHGQDIKARYPQWEFKNTMSWTYMVHAKFVFDCIDNTCAISWGLGHFLTHQTFKDIIADEERILEFCDRLYEDSDTLIEIYHGLSGALRKA